MGSRSKLGLLALVLAVLAAGWSTPPPAQALPAKFWGVVPQSPHSLEQLERLRKGGASSIRVPVSWAAVQPRRGGPIDFSGSDQVLREATRARLAVLPFLYGAPQWAVRAGRVPGAGGGALAPKRLPAHGQAGAGWKRFVRQAVLRYGPRGSFWAENPSLPRRPIRDWQIWNEPNFKYFVTKPNPAEYGRLVKLSHAAVNSADRGARVILGGLFARPAEASRDFRPPRAYFATDFLQRMYRSTPGVRHKFDGVALHPYSGRYQHLKPQIREVRNVLARNRDGGKGLWITELGWSSERPSPGNSFAKGRRGQAQQLRGAFGMLRHHQRQWRLRQVFWFSVDDLPGSCNFCDGSGLFGDGFKPKPAWHVFVGFAGGRAR